MKATILGTHSISSNKSQYHKTGLTAVFVVFLSFPQSDIEILGDNRGNIVAYNPNTSVTGSICGDYWSIKNASSKKAKL
jgi:hypothetical protein